VVPTRWPLALILVAGCLAGCSIGQRAAGPQSASCGNIPSGACDEQLERLGQRHPGAVQIDVECGPAPCTRAFGAGSATITQADGTRVTEAFTYAGDPAPVPVPICAGTAPDVCRSIAETVVENLPPAKRVAGIAIRCRVGPCDESKGDVEVTITLGDGSREVSGYGWEGGPP
jgi:hypothetical protein